METRSYIKHLKISPKKLRFVASNLSALSPSYALATLSNMPGRAPKILFKAIKSAIDNGLNLKLDQNNLKFKMLTIEQGTFLKRMRAGSKGRGLPYKHRTSHIKVILETKEPINLKKVEIDKEKEIIKSHTIEEKPELKTKSRAIKSSLKKQKKN